MSEHNAIQTVISTYSNAVTRRDWAAIAGTFAADATWEAVGGPHPMKFCGDEVGPGIKAAIGMTGSLIQLITPSVIEVDGDRAAAHCNIHEFGEMLDRKSHFEASGLYDDALEKVDGKWRFKSRICTILKFRLVSLAVG
jgi:ketosteroid isomerase-like protein